MAEQVWKRAAVEDVSKEERASLRAAFVTKTNASNQFRMEKQLNDYVSAEPKAPNKRMREKGVDRPAAVLGQVQMKDLKPIELYRQKLVDEIKSRDASYSPTRVDMRINPLKSNSRKMHSMRIISNVKSEMSRRCNEMQINASPHTSTMPRLKDFLTS